MDTPVDPRTARSRDAILAAAHTLLVREGPASVTHQRVAHEAGVGRATVYRHWQRADHLLLAAMSGSDLPFFRSPTSPVRPWLHQELRKLADELTLPAVAAVTLTLMQTALWDPDAATRRNHSSAAVTTRITTALDLAQETGELTTVLPSEDAAALLIGPMLYRTAMEAGTVSDMLISHLLDSVGTWRD
ncbi:TetR/AcrR family transcriptional regulator [Umezawaea tangerina]|uniref:TetR family transcriptional regulator n=1 Tax=Umezawaea tangerina TaxID=84725 RepID=A0A2T0TG17_9PSEU|nr:TetR/AcrR family transcriptional regulator [Umezawaea tangerina]PRY44573.1 TetR family transcriptional regulator [Umezawaea tangerina]